MIRHIPPKETKNWTGIYPHKFAGTFSKTFNVDLDRVDGAVKLSPRMFREEDSTELTDLSGDSNRVLAFIRTDADCTDRYWALSPVTLFKTDSQAFPDPSVDWDTDALDSSPTDGMNDFTVHGNDSRNDSGRNKLLVSLDSDIAVLNDSGNSAWTGSWWVTKHSQAALDTNFPHPIESFPNRRITLLGDGHRVHTISRPSDTQNDTVTYGRLILNKDLVVNHIFTTAERAWICCFNRRLERAAIVEWDGFSESPNRVHEVYGPAVLTGVNYGGQPIALNGKGVFLEYTGTGFVPMVRGGQEVVLFSKGEPGRTLVAGTRMRAIADSSVHRRGMVVSEDGLIYINFAGSNNGGFGNSETVMSGIWCLNPLTGRIYNKYSLTTDNDFGHQLVNAAWPGGLYFISNDLGLYGKILLAGGGVTMNSTGSTVEGGIWLLGNLVDQDPTWGYIVTQWIMADQLREFWDKLWTRFGRLRGGANNKIVVKARTQTPLTITDAGSPLDIAVTFTSTTTLTVTVATSNGPLLVGDEVEILRGANAGAVAHITDISGAHTALQTITLDETFPVGSGTATARFVRWKKLSVISGTNLTGEFMHNIGIDATMIQFKILFIASFTDFYPNDFEVYNLVVKSNPSINLE